MTKCCDDVYDDCSDGRDTTCGKQETPRWERSFDTSHQQTVKMNRSGYRLKLFQRSLFCCLIDCRILPVVRSVVVNFVVVGSVV